MAPKPKTEKKAAGTFIRHVYYLIFKLCLEMTRNSARQKNVLAKERNLRPAVGLREPFSLSLCEEAR
jgi:hypothetical protein